jgi:hypothetical protein
MKPPANAAAGRTPVVIVTTYLAYLASSICVTVWVASTLHKNGRVFLVDSFGGNRELADSVNHLLVVGFYLINLGYAMAVLKETQRPDDAAGGIELFARKLGYVLLVLGGMHFWNVFIFSRVRRRALLANAAPPVAPQAYLVAAPAPESVSSEAARGTGNSRAVAVAGSSS